MVSLQMHWIHWRLSGCLELGVSLHEMHEVSKLGVEKAKALEMH